MLNIKSFFTYPVISPIFSKNNVKTDLLDNLHTFSNKENSNIINLTETIPKVITKNKVNDNYEDSKLPKITTIPETTNYFDNKNKILNENLFSFYKKLKFIFSIIKSNKFIHHNISSDQLKFIHKKIVEIYSDYQSQNIIELMQNKIEHRISFNTNLLHQHFNLLLYILLIFNYMLSSKSDIESTVIKLIMRKIMIYYNSSNKFLISFKHSQYMVSISKVNEYIILLNKNLNCISKIKEDIYDMYRSINISNNKEYYKMCINISKNKFKSSLESDEEEEKEKENIENLSDSTSHLARQAVSSFYISEKSEKPYTLVLDLDETLVHFSLANQKIYYRPYLAEFLIKVKKFYEIIVFTASIKEYADFVLNTIEEKIGQKLFDYRFYREHTTFKDNIFNKDLSKIGRELDKIIIVDNVEDNFSLQKDNGILISSFINEGEVNFLEDTCLHELKNLLINFVVSENKEINYDVDLREKIKENTKYIDDKISKINYGIAI